MKDSEDLDKGKSKLRQCLKSLSQQKRKKRKNNIHVYVWWGHREELMRTVRYEETNEEDKDRGTD